MCVDDQHSNVDVYEPPLRKASLQLEIRVAAVAVRENVRLSHTTESVHIFYENYELLSK